MAPNIAHAPILSMRWSLTNLLIQQRLERFEKVFQMMNDIHCTKILISKSYIFCPFWIDTHLFCLKWIILQQTENEVHSLGICEQISSHQAGWRISKFKAEYSTQKWNSNQESRHDCHRNFEDFLTKMYKILWLSQVASSPDSDLVGARFIFVIWINANSQRFLIVW